MNSQSLEEAAEDRSSFLSPVSVLDLENQQSGPQASIQTDKEIKQESCWGIAWKILKKTAHETWERFPYSIAAGLAGWGMFGVPILWVYMDPLSGTPCNCSRELIKQIVVITGGVPASLSFCLPRNLLEELINKICCVPGLYS